MSEPGMLNHISYALSDLRLLAHFVASTPDRRFTERDLASGLGLATGAGSSGTGKFSDPVENLFLSISTMLLYTPQEIADPTNPERAAQLFFMLDRLNAIVWPATPDSIRLTSAYLGYFDGSSTPVDPPASGASATTGTALAAAGAAAGVPLGLPGPDPMQAAQIRGALQQKEYLSQKIESARLRSVLVLAATLVISIYALFGQITLAERERVLRELEAERATFYANAKLSISASLFRLADRRQFHLMDPESFRDWVTEICPRITLSIPEAMPVVVAAAEAPPSPNVDVRVYPSTDHMRSCERFEILRRASLDADRAVQAWVGVVYAVIVSPVTWVVDQVVHWVPSLGAEAAPLRPGAEPPGNGLDFRFRSWGETVITALSSYILPILFGAIGAWVAAERELRRRLERFEVTRTDGRRFQRSLIIGAVVGGVVGLFFSDAQLKSLSLNFSAVALLAGFSGDRVFRFFDELIDRLFSIHRPPPGSNAAAPPR